MQMLNVLLNLVLNSVLINLSLWKLSDRLFLCMEMFWNVTISVGEGMVREVGLV